MTLLDDEGRSRAEWGSDVAAVRMKWSLDGKAISGVDTVSWNDESDLTLRGLRSSVRLMNGTSANHFTSLSRGILSTSLVTTRITDLVFDAYPNWSLYPKSGSITSTFSEASPGLAPSELTLTMTFNGTAGVAVTKTTHGVTSHCTFDLRSSALTCQ